MAQNISEQIKEGKQIDRKIAKEVAPLRIKETPAETAAENGSRPDSGSVQFTDAKEIHKTF